MDVGGTVKVHVGCLCYLPTYLKLLMIVCCGYTAR